MGDARSVSLIAIHTHDIPQAFPPAALDEAERAPATSRSAGATDLRDMPLVTIDGEDARDFDDAVFAEPDGDGFRLIVAIADVAHYVRPESALDHAARDARQQRLFPRPRRADAAGGAVERLVQPAARARIAAACSSNCTSTPPARKTAHRFGRGLMRSAARLTYEAGAARPTTPATTLGYRCPSLCGVPRPAGRAARRAARSISTCRSAGSCSTTRAACVSVAPRPRLDSHRLIEEFMVARQRRRRRGTGAAAPALRCIASTRRRRTRSWRRCASFLHGLGISLPPGDQVHPRDLDRVLRRVAGTPEAPLVNEVMLRSQSQAEYSPDNIGHFGLALPRYAHFTSPIRRYADLLVHRALIRGLRLGDGGLAADEAAALRRRRRSTSPRPNGAPQLAERDAIDRYLAAYMADKVGANFAARISGVTRFGLFVTVAESGASGLVPVRSLPDDYWQHDEREQTLTGRRTRLVFRLAQEVEVRLAEASPVTGGLVFHILQGVPVRRRQTQQGDGPDGDGDPHRRPAVPAADRARARANLCAGRPAGFDPRLVGRRLCHRARVHGAAHAGTRAGLAAHRLGPAWADRAGSRR